MNGIPQQTARRIAISGASGLIGGMLKASLTHAGHEVWTLVRRSADAGAREIAWDPEQGTIDAAALEAMDALVHLSGKNIGEGRWNARRKETFARSRIESTRLLAQTLTRLKKPPGVLVSASATGIYGDRGDEPLTESSEPGDGFLPQLCEQWEAAASPARDAGIRVVHPRIGVVLSAHGGALPKMAGPARFGLAGRIGSGRQYISWIAAEDLLDVFVACIMDDRLAGPVNAVSPNPVPQRQFAKTLARVLHRPALLPLPAFVVRLAFGEMGRTLLLEGARVLPARLQSIGFVFRLQTIEAALRRELDGRSRSGRSGVAGATPFS